MFGQKNYKLPGSKKPQASVEPEESIEVGEPYDDEIDTFEASRTDDLAYEDDEYYDDEDYEDMIPSGDSNYYFEAQEEEEKPAPPRMVAFESNRRDINSFEQLVDKVEKEEALEQSEKQEEAPKGFNPRDENEPFLPPPGYVWSSEMFVRLPFWNMDHLLNAIGIGESSKRYMGGIDSDKWFEAEYGPVRNEDSLLLDGGLSETETLTKKSNVTPPIITAEMRAKYLEEMQAADDNPISAGDIVLASAFIPVEPEEGPPGWQIWRGERWDRFWNGYGTPTSYTGYPVQWFYRTVHFLFPETIDEFEYEHHAGELSLRYVQQFTYWFFTHPCIPTMLLHGSLVFPFFFWKRRLPYRQKIIENRMARGRSLFRTMDEHVSSIILRRLRPPRNRTTKRLFRWICFLTFIFSPNCWDVRGMRPHIPTDEWWEKNYIRKYTDGVATKSEDLQKWLHVRPPPNDGLTTKPHIESYKRSLEEFEKLQNLREERRKEMFGTRSDQYEGWKELAATEQRHRYAALQYKSSLETVTENASSKDL